MKVRLVEKPVMDSRGDNRVVIFPSRPYWFAASSEIESVLACFDQHEEKLVIQTMQQALDIDDKEARATFGEVRDLLYNAGVLLINGELSPDLQKFAPTVQVNSVENVLVIAATQACNLHCGMCYARAAKPMKDEMTTEEIVVILDQLSSMPWGKSMSRVALTGGEFFTRMDALDLVEAVHSRGYFVQLNTNATLLTTDQISQLATYEHLHVSVSLDGSNPDVHEFIRGANTFATTISNIAKLCMAGVNVAINMFVHADNMSDIGKVLALADSLGVCGFNCLNMMHVGRANDQGSKERLRPVPLADFYRAVFETIKDNSRFQELMLQSTFANQLMGVAAGVKSHTCGIGTNRAVYVKADGSLYPCADTAIPAFRLGNLRTDDLGDIWENSLLLERLRKLDVDTMNEVCAICPVRYLCGGNCRGENYQVTRNLTGPHFKCDDLRASIIELMWILVERPDLFASKTKDLYEAVMSHAQSA